MENSVRKHIWMIFKFAVVLTTVGLLMGLYSREVTRPLEMLTMEQFLFAQNWIVLTHGHAMFYGGVIPLALAFVTYMFRRQFTKEEKTLKSLRTAFIVYMIGALMMLSLSTYKGSAFIFGLIKDPTLSLDAIDAGLFGGNVMLRSLLYTIAHPAFAVGLIWYLVVIWRKAKKNI